MKDYFNSVSDPSRRQFMELAAKTCLGVSIAPLGMQTARAATTLSSDGGQAKSVIYLFMEGAMSHLDTFDPKPGREVQGETKVINTQTPGMVLSEYLPNIAKQSSDLAIIRSLYTETADHEGARYLARTSYKKIASIRHPSLGSMSSHMLGRGDSVLPTNVTIGIGGRHPRHGYLDPSHSPLPISDANKGLENTKAPAYLTDAFQRRMNLIQQFDRTFQKRFQQPQVAAYNEFYQQAQTLLTSDDVKVFDLNEEKDELRDKYGRNRLGQGALLARRLVEGNVRYVEVGFGGWDMHNDLWDRMPNNAGVLDQAVGSLISDLKQRGLLDQTLVVVGSEFGRKPSINVNAGRDHHPVCFSGLLAGGGIRGGQVYGGSDEDAFQVNDDPVSIEDYNATIAYAMGLDLSKEIYSPDGRPFRVANEGAPVIDIF